MMLWRKAASPDLSFYASKTLPRTAIMPRSINFTHPSGMGRGLAIGRVCSLCTLAVPMREETPLLTNHIGAQASLRRLHEHAKFSSIHQEKQGECCTWGQVMPRSPVTLLRHMPIDISALVSLPL